MIASLPNLRVGYDVQDSGPPVLLNRVGHGINVQAADAVNDTVSRFWAGK